ncbi:hypothetical protein BJY00DRAFT_278319 [Aspergillus carlsbadensis]|nr:hypothetical protein BJY00DRAFT_278319 [Aspergillus carlsbadensis]
MLLTLNPSSQHGIPGPYEHSRFRYSVPTPRSPSPSTSNPSTSTAPTTSADSSMDTARDRLPRPSSLTLPPPDVGFTSMASATPNQQLPHPPAQWQTPEDALHYWRARAEEDRRKQEEEKTRQETLRLEQRRVEQSMLRDSLMAGIPPHIIPLIFAGICQGGLPQPVLELTQHYLAQVSGARGHNPPVPPQLQSRSNSHSSSHTQRPSVHTRQDSRSVPASPFSSAAQQVVPPPPNILLSQTLPPTAGGPHTQQPRGGPSTPSGPPDSRHVINPWSNTADLVQNQLGPIGMGNVQYAPGSSVPALPGRTRPGSRSRRSPPSLYFHHWVPPAQPNTASGKIHQEAQAISSNPRRSEHQASPGRKRKAPGPHQPAPVPSSLPPESLSASNRISRPGSPRGVEKQEEVLRHRHYSSGTSVSHGIRPPGVVKAEEMESISPTRVASTATGSPQYPLPRARTKDFANQSRGSDLESSP